MKNLAEKVALKSVAIPYDSLKKISQKNKYSLYLLGHIFNEIMALGKLSVMSQMKVGDGSDITEVERAGYVFNSMFFLRLLAGKIYEAQLSLRSKDVHDFLRDFCYPNMEASDCGLLKTFNKEASGCRWLNAARNGHAMHYPTFAQCEKVIGQLDAGRQPFEFFMGERVGNTLYRSSDVMAGASFLMEADGESWRGGLEVALADLQRLSELLAEFITESIHGFAEGRKKGKVRYSEKLKIKDVKKFSTPNINDFELPYFMSLGDDKK
ncbi:hypothetical protein [Cupriavidus basilensis]|uniref:hypothetical protein n=1 Tax=Cupriavidus basilensis TaxID=68895 RepID=UPI00285110CB|nr:hypothetical protein [Cupriavidus basilensis]MDR3382328.1 hypothetical protein [Cupriavidus basilensis]